MAEIEQIDKDVQKLFTAIFEEVHKVIIGHDEVIENILIALFSDGHVLLEGVPGMGKTVLTKTISATLDCKFRRIQCTPDLTPSDIIGKLYFDERKKKYEFAKGPIFTNILLVDEINRAPPKTQSALLEAMAERQVTVGGVTYKLEDPFIVIATQNPIEQEGTYPLPEAQLDRFLFKIVLEYPSIEEEMRIMKSTFKKEKINKIFNPAEIRIIKKEIENSVTIPDIVLEYVAKIVDETRRRREVINGASPRASIAFVRAIKVKAFIEGRDSANFEDVRKLAYPILRHRLILYPHFSEMGMTPDYVISKILQKIEVPA